MAARAQVSQENLLFKDPSQLNPKSIHDHINEYLPILDSKFPSIDIGLLHTAVTNPKIRDDSHAHIRHLLRAFKGHKEFRKAFKCLELEKQYQLLRFMAGRSPEEAVSKSDRFSSTSLSIKKKFQSLKDAFRPSRHFEWQKVEQMPIIYEDQHGKQMETYSFVPIRNWGGNLTVRPRYTFVPTTVQGVQNLVKYARANKLRVRVGGYRHSWSPTFADTSDDSIFISLLGLDQASKVPNAMAVEPHPGLINGSNELKTIGYAAPTVQQVAAGKYTVRLGAAVTSEDFRRWLVSNGQWALPMDTVLVEVTIAGVNAMICHGGGRQHQTIADQVRAIEYVDANGNLQRVSDPVQLRAAAGCFGLLGVVTHITLEVDQMTYALMRPTRPHINLAIPPMSLEDVPEDLRQPFSNEEMSAALLDFERRANDEYYSEWFWMPYQDSAWVNTWATTADPTGAQSYPSYAGTWFQWIQGWLAGVMIQTDFFNQIPTYWQSYILGLTAMSVLPVSTGRGDTTTIKTYMPDALHWRRGTQNMRVRDLEFEIPLTPSAEDPTNPDYSIARRAWWDIINLVYATPGSPMRLSLEMRIMADSNLIMAPQAGNSFGTVSIEVLSIPNAVEDGEWGPFAQAVTDIWTKYEIDGAKLNTRPHWAKEWDGLDIGGMPARQYLKEVAYCEAIPEFRSVLKQIGEEQGWTLEELQAMFSNKLWDYIVFS